MTQEKVQNTKSKKRHDVLMDIVQVKCESDNIKHLKFINNEDLQIYHDTYVKLNTMHNMDTIIYYITENDLNKICNDKVKKIHVKLENKSKKQDKKYDISTNEIKSLIVKLNDEFKEDNEIVFDKNIYYDVNDIEEYETFALFNKNGIISYYGMDKNSVNSFALVEQQFTGKMIDYELNNLSKALFIIYSKEWPTYTYPIYVIIHDYKFTTKKFIMIFNILIDLIAK